MQTQGMFSVGGIASGLDTEGMIEQLLSLERRPIQRLQQQQQELEGDRDAWGEVTTKLSSVRSAVDGLDRLADFDEMTSVDSSDEGVLGVSATGPVREQTTDITVEQLASRMQQAGGDTFSGPDAEIGGRQLQLTTTVDGEEVVHDITGQLGGDATLADLVDAVNDAGIGVRASALQVSPGDYQLVLESEETGTTNAFEVNTGLADDGWTEGITVTDDARDAQLRIGGVEVSRPSNTIDDLIDGVELDLHAVSDGPVTVSAGRDVDAAVGALGEFVEAANAAFGTIAELSDYDIETEESGPLQGDPSLSRIATQLRDAISRPIAGLEGSDALASDLGISLTRDGQIEFDESRARAAFEEDFDAAAARLARSGSTTDDAARFSTATSATEPGTYDVEVTQMAAVAEATATYEQPTGERVLRFSQAGADPVEVVLTADDETAADAAARIQSALEADGSLDLLAEADGDQLTVRTTSFGSNAGFTVEELDGAGEVDPGGDALGLEGEHVGIDAEGTIDGQAATGTGNLLRATDGPAEGLLVALDDEPEGSFQVSYTRGLMGQVGEALSRAEGSDGLVERARNAIDRQSELFDDRIEAFERRVESRERTIRQQFVAMERALGQFNEQSSQLQQQLAQLG